MDASGWAGWREGGEGGRPRCSPLGGEGEEVVARILARVGACADELRLLEVEREKVHGSMGSAGEDWGSYARNTSRARVPPSMELM